MLIRNQTNYMFVIARSAGNDRRDVAIWIFNNKD